MTGARGLRAHGRPAARLDHPELHALRQQPALQRDAPPAGANPNPNPHPNPSPNPGPNPNPRPRPSPSPNPSLSPNPNPSAPLAAVEEETPRGAAGSAETTPRPAAVVDGAGPTESRAGCTNSSSNNEAAAAAAAAAAVLPGASTDELDGIDEDEEGDPMIALYLA